MAKIQEAQVIQLDHSKAKVKLYSEYLAVYIQIINKAEWLKKVYIYDLFCGEGIYEDGEKGSPVVAREKIRNLHLGTNGDLRIDCFFNDIGYSQIEPDILKTDRIKNYINKNFGLDNRLSIYYTNEDFVKHIKTVNYSLSKLKSNERALLFIDPYGYKEIFPVDLKASLISGRTELLLFLPIHHMYRFFNKTLKEEDFPGGKPLKKFINELYANKGVPGCNSSFEFSENLCKEFKKYTEAEYVDMFTIDRGNNNIYCLFFFTNNKLGYRKMLETKWKIDEDSGRGYKVTKNSDQMDMFSTVENNGYTGLLEKVLKVREMSNHELYDFGLNNGFLPKHTTQVLGEFKKQGVISINSGDSDKVSGMYIDNRKRTIFIKWL